MSPRLARARVAVRAGESKMGRRAGHKYGGGPGWLVTLVDLVSLMLAFFVLRFAMTTLDGPQYLEAAGSIVASLNREVTVVEPTAPVLETVQAERTRRGFALAYLEPVLAAKMAGDPVLQRARVARSGDRLVISLPSDLLFPSGGVDLTPAARRAVAELTTAIETLPNRIDVVGHADPQPMSGAGRFATNWELSLARADAVARQLVDTGFPRIPTVEGVGDSRFSEIAPTLDLERRYALARRVDLVVFPERAP